MQPFQWFTGMAGDPGSPTIWLPARFKLSSLFTLSFGMEDEVQSGRNVFFARDFKECVSAIIFDWQSSYWFEMFAWPANGYG